MQLHSSYVLTDPKGTVLIAVSYTHRDVYKRQILDFVSQKPVGYVSLLCKHKYFQEIVEDISTIYTSGSYLIDESGIVVSSNRPEGIGRPLPFLSGPVSYTHLDVYKRQVLRDI